MMSTMFTAAPGAVRQEPNPRRPPASTSPAAWGLLNLWSDPKMFDVDAFVDGWATATADFLQGCFQMLSPVRNILG